MKNDSPVAIISDFHVWIEFLRHINVKFCVSFGSHVFDHVFGADLLPFADHRIHRSLR